MRNLLGGVLCALVVAGLSFFVVFAFHADTPLRQETQALLEGAPGSFAFSPAASAHMEDVRAVLSWLRVSVAAALLAWLATLPLLDVRSVLRVAGGLLVGSVVFAALLPWDALFSGMHAVLFPQGNWRFPAESLLITTYPEGFFVGYALAWGALCVLAGLSLLAASHVRN